MLYALLFRHGFNDDPGAPKESIELTTAGRFCLRLDNDRHFNKAGRGSPAGVGVSYGPGVAFGIVFVEQDREVGRSVDIIADTVLVVEQCPVIDWFAFERTCASASMARSSATVASGRRWRWTRCSLSRKASVTARVMLSPVSLASVRASLWASGSLIFKDTQNPVAQQQRAHVNARV